ncbi:MAG: hypothetical protein E6Q97_12475 [Desulfurellales bacterium]|nr:MAG: hypothetical protein E6Q97_12475 [Desulfurellales bacterium]
MDGMVRYSSQYSGSFVGIRGNTIHVSYFPEITDFMGFDARDEGDSYFASYGTPERFCALTCSLLVGTINVLAASLPPGAEEWDVTHERDRIRE